MCTAIRTPSASSSNSTQGPPGNQNLCMTAQTANAARGVRIPKILHQTYKHTNLPPGLNQFHNSWLQMTPDWEHHIWTDSDNRALVAEHYPWYLSLYDSYRVAIQRVDAARIFILHRYGGLYADLDIEVLQDPSIFLGGDFDMALFYDFAEVWVGGPYWDPKESKFVPQFETPINGVSNSIMASVPGNDFWMQLARSMMNRWFDGRWQDEVMGTTGPLMLSMHLDSWMKRWPQTSVAVYPRKYWAPFIWNLAVDPCADRLKCKATYPEAVVVSHWTGTWKKCKEYAELGGEYEFNAEEYNATFCDLTKSTKSITSNPCA